ncbi:MAG: MFS transporter [Chloroflexota bacterium]|nr:MFS transporter [Chloroflexota bacterium]
MDPITLRAEATAEAEAELSPSEPGHSLTRFYGYQLVAEIGLTGGIWILYLQHLGLSLTQIGIAEAVFHLAPITLELPSGSLADVFGRKWTLALSSLCVALAAFLMLMADTLTNPLWLVFPAMYLSGASFAFRSGSAEAFLYDSLAERGGAGTFSKLLGRILSASYLLLAVTTWVGAVLADVNFGWPYALTVAVGLGGVWLAVGLQEPVRERVAHRSLRRTMAEALTIVRGRPRLAMLLVFTSALWAMLTLVNLYAQAVLSELGLSTSMVGLVIGATLLFTAAGMWFAHRITDRGTFRLWAVTTALLIVGAGLGLGSGVLLLAIAIYLVAELFAGIFEPLLSARINDSLAAPQRATILSIEGLMFSVTMVWAFPLVGLVADRAGWLAAFGGAGVVVIILLTLWLIFASQDEAPLDV